MAIYAGDIKLVKSQVMDDVPEGGGAPTSNVVQDGVSNNIFDDITEVDRAGGSVSLRKLHLLVATNNTDTYMDANIIVARPPSDPLVSVTLFSTEDTFDRRASAASRMEAYLVGGPQWPAILYGNHVEGQRSVQLFARPGSKVPSPGKTILLRQNEGGGSEYEQYVRVTRVETEERSFFYAPQSVDYVAMVITCDISDALRYDFTGSEANREFKKETAAAVVRDTTVANAIEFYGVTALTQAAEVGDSSVKVASIFSQVVPNARTETPLLDQIPANALTVTLATSPRLIEVGAMPHTQRVRVTQENTGFNYTTILKPVPAPGACLVTYRSNGQNYEIRDNGDGTMGGDGTGIINYLTGSVNVTLLALPDDRSNVVFYWGEAVAYTNRAGTAGFRSPEYSYQLPHQGIKPSSLTITWTSGEVVKTATSNSAGKLTGDATGEIVYPTGVVRIRPIAMPDAGTEFLNEYEYNEIITETKSGLTPDPSGMVNFEVDEVPTPGTITVRWITTKTVSRSSGSAVSMSNSEKNSSTSVSVTAEQMTHEEWKPPVFRANAPGYPSAFTYDEYGRIVAV